MNRLTVSRALDVAILTLTLAYGVLFLLSEILPSDVGAGLERLDLIFTIALLSALLAQFSLALEKRRWLAANWVDLVIILVLAFPLLRVLRFYRYLPIARGAQVTRLALFMSEGVRAHLRGFGRGEVHNILVTAAVVVVLAAVLVQFAERGVQEANIQSLGDAMWWAMTTVTTVGYGDTFPTTGPGRIVAGALMVLGIALFGVLTAALSSLFVAQARQPETTKVQRELEALREEIVALRNAVVDLAAASADRGVSPRTDGVEAHVAPDDAGRKAS